MAKLATPPHVQSPDPGLLPVIEMTTYGACLIWPDYMALRIVSLWQGYGTVPMVVTGWQGAVAALVAVGTWVASMFGRYNNVTGPLL